MGSSADNVRAGGAFVEVFTENSRLGRGLKQAQGMLTGWATGLKSIGSRIAAPLALAGVTGIAGVMALGEQFGELGAQAADMADRIGTSTEAVTELSHAAEYSAADATTLERGWMAMQKTIAGAASGSKSQNQALAALGMTAAELLAMKPEDQFAALADGVNLIEDPAKRTAAAMAVFGKSGQQLLPLLSEGSEGIAALRQEARDLGRSMSREDADAAATLTDSIGRLKAALTATAFSLVGAIAPALTTAFTWVTRLTGGVTRWVSENRPLILTAIKVAAAVGGIGLALIALGMTFTLLSTAIGGLLSLLSAVGVVLAFLTSPIGLVIAGVAGLTVWFLTFTTTGRNALGWLADAFSVLAGEATTAWGGIVAAIQAGDLQTAFEVAMAFLRVQWVRVTNWLESKWLDFKDGFMTVWDEAMAFFSKLFIDSGATLEIAWVNTLNFLLNAWTQFTGAFMAGWRTAQNFVGKGFGWLIAKMSGLDPNEVMAEMDADLARRNQAAAGDNAATIAQRNQSRDQRLQQIRDGMDPVTREMFDNIDAATASKREARELARSQAMQREEETLAKAQADLAAAAAKATALQADAATGNKPGAPSAQASLAAGADRTAKTAASADIRSAEGLRQILSAFGGGRPDQQIASNTARTADELANVNRNLEDFHDDVRRSDDDTLSLSEAGS